MKSSHIFPRRLLLRITFSVLLIIAAHTATATSSALPTSSELALQIPQIEDVDILYINDEVKHWLDKNIRPIKRKTDRASTLHQMLFHPMYKGIRYDSRTTKTAQETYDSGAGNCVSLASLYVASARYLGLNARFQTVAIPREWEDEENFYVVPGHVNAIINLPRDKVTVEFANIYSAWRTQFLKSKKISDHQLFAEYYNNLGMEHLQEGNVAHAIAYLNKAIDTHKSLSFIWSNLGVAYKLSGQLNQAETAYKKAIRLDRTNLSPINNLYILYSQTGKEKAAEKLAKKVERYSRRNPYYLYKLARSDYELKNYESALQYLKRAVRKKPHEAKFHVLLGQTYYKMGNLIQSSESLRKAVKYAESDNIDRFQSKLEALERLRAGR